jgi:endoglucanase
MGEDGMKTDSKRFLEDLLNTPGVAGFEQPVQAVVRDRLRGACDEARTDVAGNVIAGRNAGAPFRVLLDGHVDEIGLMVNHVDEKGFINFVSVGGVNAALTQGDRVTIHDERGDVPGVIGVKPIHLIDPEDRGKVKAKFEQQWIDIGAKDRKDALRVVAIGDSITFDVKMVELRNGLVSCRGMDDRVGVFCVVEAMRRLKGQKLGLALFVCSSVQEELGLKGARVSAFGIDPHVGIAVDVGFASDFPDVDKKVLGDIALGKGPIIARGPTYNPVLVRLIEATAKKKRIPYQVQADPGRGGTNAAAFQLNRAGAAAGLVSVPNRYMHSCAEVVSLEDLDNVVELLAQTVLAIKPGVSFTP